MRILTFDIEDWFHILDNASTKTEKDWLKYDSRIVESVERILYELDEKNICATFFCLGWIAEKHPEVIRSIADHGHEIGTHSHMHQLVYEMTPKQFEQDLRTSIRILEDITGKPIKSYRSPGFSITKDTLWAFDILTENGIDQDCSIFPANRAHGGMPNINSHTPFNIKINGTLLKEYPMSVYQLNRFKIGYSGGGYFRLLPYKMIKNIIKKQDYVMTYFHPRDFDAKQPVLNNLSFTKKFRAYHGIDTSFRKFQKLINEFDFISLSEFDKTYNWDSCETISFQ